MYQPEAYGIALLFMIGSMLCWGSWANTMKLTPGWAFQLFYWDYVIGIIAASLLWGLTLGSVGGGELSFLRNIASADSHAHHLCPAGRSGLQCGKSTAGGGDRHCRPGSCISHWNWPGPRRGSSAELLHFAAGKSLVAVWRGVAGCSRDCGGRVGVSPA